MMQKTINFLPVTPITSDRLIRIFTEYSRHKKIVCVYANVHSYMIARRNTDFQNALCASDIVYPDGWGVVLAAKAHGIPVYNRMTAYDFFPQFLSAVQKKGLSLYLLGTTKNRIKKTVSAMFRQYPNIQIKGYHHGYMKTKKEEDHIIEEIKRKKPDILLIGMGTPKQELWAHSHKNLPVKVIWCVGGLFDYLSGDIQHCPRWLGDRGFQWTWRLIHEPKRLWKRYLLELPQFFIYSMKAKLFP